MATKTKLPEEIRSELIKRVTELGTRQEKTREVAYTLFFRHNIFPSAAAVREITDHGSLNDIQSDLREFWDDIRSRNTSRMNLPSMPDDVSRGFSELFAKMWDLALAQAQDMLQDERLEIEASVSKIRMEIEDAQREQRFAEERRNAVIEELQSERVQREEAEQSVAALQANIVGLNRSIDDWMILANDRKQELETGITKFLSEIDAIRKAHARDLEVIEGEKHFAMLQIDNARTQVSDLKNQITTIRADNEIELAMYRKGNNELREKNGTLMLEIGEMRGRLASTIRSRSSRTVQKKRLQRNKPS
jgi:chromosome segregation ATPase